MALWRPASSAADWSNTMECRKPTTGKSPREARAKWRLEGWVRELEEGEVDALMSCASGSFDDEEDAVVEHLVLECASRYCPIQPLAPRPVPEEWTCPGFCAALPPDPERRGW